MLNIFAVVVTYYHDEFALSIMVSSLVHQGFKVVVVNNAADCPVVLDADNKVAVFNMGYNAGIAEGQNIGIRYSIENECSHICFFDQDSIIPDNYAKEMLKASSFYSHRCLLAPVAIDAASNEEIPSHKINKFGYPCSHYAISGGGNSKTDIVISSGMFVSFSVLQEVGGMDADYFIDFVDIDFCLRLRKFGIPVFVVTNLRMRHNIGDGDVSVLGFNTSVHSCVRTYYKTRNAFILIYKIGPSVFSFTQLLAAIFHGFLSSVHDFPSMKKFGFYLKGIAHGLIFKKGYLDE